MSNPQESYPANSGDNYVGCSIDPESLVPLNPERWAVVESAVEVAQGFLDGTGVGSAVTYQVAELGSDVERATDNERAHLLVELSNRVFKEDLPAMLAASERELVTTLAHEDAKQLGLKVEEKQTVTAPAVRRAASFFTKTGMVLVEETEVLANKGTVKMRVLSVRTV